MIVIEGRVRIKLQCVVRERWWISVLRGGAGVSLRFDADKVTVMDIEVNIAKNESLQKL